MSEENYIFMHWFIFPLKSQTFVGNSLKLLQSAFTFLKQYFTLFDLLPGSTTRLLLCSLSSGSADTSLSCSADTSLSGSTDTLFSHTVTLSCASAALFSGPGPVASYFHF